ncbi:hypothetical protein [Halorussus halobius]|uniref:hypothetical protein n=1 Tax=Halorussus halobius TaxID=1710537 RepID=UPI001092ADC5|nr:hypothetical protein [Halorussus halobius]
MGYDYTCDAQLDGCERGGDRPALAGQFRKSIWLTDDFGGRMQDKGYELGDTITICPSCVEELLAPR